MITIRIGFPAGGRWHATAWGTHVNEGVPEWPPSPWRLYRALLATWYWKHRQNRVLLDSLIIKLTEHLPAYLLPDASVAHLRHYMPVIVGKNEKTTKVFDTFVQVSKGKYLYIQWDTDLSIEETKLLSLLLKSMNYFGRAESLIEADLVDSVPVSAKTVWTLPLETKTSQPFDKIPGEIISLLVPQQSREFEQWLLKQNPEAESQKKKKKEKPLPSTIIEAMEADTADWKTEGWDVPPGSKWVQYIRPENSFKITPEDHPKRAIEKNPRVVRFAITTKVPPSITQSLSLAERFHQSIHAYLDGKNSPILTGRDQEGKPLKDNNHIYFLPECDRRGYITHLTLYTPKGYKDFDTSILGKIRKVWSNYGTGFEIHTVLLATGQPGDFSLASPYFQKSKIWESLTPFVPVRHAKASSSGTPKIDPKNGLQIGSPEHDCLRLVQLILPNTRIVNVSKVKENGSAIHLSNRRIPCLSFQLDRKHGKGVRAGKRGYALRLEFEEEVILPYGFGYGAHFGLGLFSPADTDI